MNERSDSRPCADCGRPFEFVASPRGRPRMYCDACRAERRRASGRECYKRRRPDDYPPQRERVSPGSSIAFNDPELCARIRAFAVEQRCRPSEALTYIVNRFFA